MQLTSVSIWNRFNLSSIFSRVRHWGLCLKCEIFVFLVRAASAAVTCVYQCSHRSQLPAIRIISNQNERIDQLCVNNAVVHLYAFASIIRTSGIINIWRQANLIQIKILFLFVRLSFYRSFVFLRNAEVQSDARIRQCETAKRMKINPSVWIDNK